MKKAAISIFIIVALVLNMFGFGFLETRSSAMAEVIVTTVVCPAIIGILSSVLGAKIAQVASVRSDTSGLIEAINSNSEVFKMEQLSTGDNISYRLAPVSSLSGDTLEEAQFICDYINSSPAINTFMAGFMLEHGDNLQNVYQADMKSEIYEQLCSDAVNAYCSYIEAKRFSIDTSNRETAMSELASALGHEWDPSYQFSFVGPITPAQFNDVNSIHSIDFEGVHFYAPFKIGSVDNNGWFLDRSFLVSIGCPDNDSCISLSGGQGSGYRGKTASHDSFSGSVYIIYDGDIYFGEALTVHLASKSNLSINVQNVDDYNLKRFYNLNGVSLYSAGVRRETVNGLYYGFYEWTTPGNRESRPILNSVPEEDDFIDTSSGGTLDPGLTDEEAAISSAIGLGIISDNPTLEFDNEGNLISADGISLATLESLVQELIDKTYSFESFEEYLQTITRLLQAGNVNTDKIDDVLNALRSWEASQADALDDINAAIGAAASSITSALEISASDAELDLPDLDADAFIVSHSGLAEAATITNSIPIVGQVSQLFNNLLDSSQYDNSPPDFRFYADLDNNGVSETYNAFDLSFLEYDLTNGNLADSDRFQNRLTIRQFLQYLIIFICYVAFAIRILKKLPSIFGADEGSNDFKSSEK